MKILLLILSLMLFIQVAGAQSPTQTPPAEPLTACPGDQLPYGGSDADRIYAVDLHPDGSKLAAVRAKTVSIYAADTLEPLGIVTCQEVLSGSAVDWSPDGSALATFTQADRGIEIWQTRDMSHLANLRGTADPPLSTDFSAVPNGVRALLWSPDGKWLAAAGFGGVPTRVWDVEGQAVFFESAALSLKDHWNPSPGVMAWSPDATYFAIAQSNSVVVLETATWTTVETLEAEREINSLSWSGDGRLAAGGHDNQLTVWDTTTWKPIPFFATFNVPAYTVSWLPGSSLLAVAGDQGDNGVQILDFTNETIAADMTGTQGKRLQSIQWFPDGKRFIAFMSDTPSSNLSLWKVGGTEAAAEVVSQRQVEVSNNDELDDLLARRDSIFDGLDVLVGGKPATTPLVDDSVDYALPTVRYDPTQYTWVLMQETADPADGLFKGLFKLASGCAYLTVLSHNVVTPPDNMPAHSRDCDGVPSDASTMPALNGRQVSGLEIHSSQPFSVSIRLDQTWCAAFLNGNGLSGFVSPAPMPGDTRPSGIYDVVTDTVRTTPMDAYFWGVMHWQQEQAVQLTRIKVWLTVVPGIEASGHGIQVDGELVASILANQPGIGYYQMEWKGDLSAHDISITTSAFALGSARITRVEMQGTGKRPFSGQECS